MNGGRQEAGCNEWATGEGRRQDTMNGGWQEARDNKWRKVGGKIQ